jgi:phosphoribosyl 1,2-cyclic phosphodiesterase
VSTTLTVLGSGSRGNAAVLESEGAALLLDAGFSAREIELRAERAGVDLSRLCGIALTHEHGDHARGAVRLAERRRVPIAASPGTWARVGAGSSARHLAVAGGGRAECGPFLLAGCALLHDAAEPLALTVTGPDGIRLGVAYDFGRPTQALRYHFRELDAILVEANYDEVMLRTGGYPASVQQRIAGSDGHLSNRGTAQLLAELFHPGLGTVVLAHLSQRCNTPEAARAEVHRALSALGFTGQLAVAAQDAPVGPFGLARRPPPLPSAMLHDLLSLS